MIDDLVKFLPLVNLLVVPAVVVLAELRADVARLVERVDGEARRLDGRIDGHGQRIGRIEGREDARGSMPAVVVNEAGRGVSRGL